MPRERRAVTYAAAVSLPPMRRSSARKSKRISSEKY